MPGITKVHIAKPDSGFVRCGQVKGIHEYIELEQKQADFADYITKNEEYCKSCLASARREQNA